MADGYVFHIDGPLSLFSATNKYGLQMALFLPALLLCRDFRLDAELRWGPRRDPRTFHLDANDGLVSHYADTGTYVPAELGAFVERFRQVAPAWEVSEATDVLELGREGVWVPDYRFVHKADRRSTSSSRSSASGSGRASTGCSGSSPSTAPPRYLLAISDRFKVDEGAPRRTRRAGPPLQGDPQRRRAGRAARPLPPDGRPAPDPLNGLNPRLMDP